MLLLPLEELPLETDDPVDLLGGVDTELPRELEPEDEVGLVVVGRVVVGLVVVGRLVVGLVVVGRVVVGLVVVGRVVVGLVVVGRVVVGLVVVGRTVLVSDPDLGVTTRCVFGVRLVPEEGLTPVSRVPPRTPLRIFPSLFPEILVLVSPERLAMRPSIPRTIDALEVRVGELADLIFIWSRPEERTDMALVDEPP